jgi:hypothetical protein
MEKFLETQDAEVIFHGDGLMQETAFLNKGINMQDANWTNDSFMEDNRGKMAVFFHTVQVQNNFKS